MLVSGSSALQLVVTCSMLSQLSIEIVCETLNPVSHEDAHPPHSSSSSVGSLVNYLSLNQEILYYG